jgi:dTMP kinase
VATGRLITFEGIEGSGKTTQIELLARHLGRRGLAVRTTREPGGTPLGECLRGLLLDPALHPEPVAELLILEAARAQLVAQEIAPALARGEFVLCDRFADSSLAYQGSARGLGWDVVRPLNALACGTTSPDRTLVLDLDVADALARARHRPTTTAFNRRFEDEAEAFHRSVAAAFRELAAAEPGRVRLLDAGGTPEHVHARVLAALADLLP